MDVGKVNTGQRVVFRLPYVGERHCHLERRVRSIVRLAFDDGNVVTVYNVRRAFTVVKDILPICSTEILLNTQITLILIHMYIHDSITPLKPLKIINDP